MPAFVTHVYRRPIRFADTDAAGVAHFSRLLPIVEETLHDFFQSRAVPILDRENAWPVVSIHADYSSGCRFQDEITIALSLDKIGNTSLSFSFAATKANGTPCFEGKVTLCHVDPALQTSAPIPTKTKHALRADVD